MAEMSTELLAKLRRAKSLAEITKLLKTNGQDIARAEKIWHELEVMHEQEDKKLSLDELDAVAGGVGHRNWLEEGCAASVEPASDCWGTDGGCTWVTISYEAGPDYSERCPECGGYVYAHGGANYGRITCPKCGTFYQDSYGYSGTWVKES